MRSLFDFLVNFVAFVFPLAVETVPFITLACCQVL